MKIEPVVYMYGDMALEVIGETEVEIAYLKTVWKELELCCGNGRSIGEKRSIGFYIKKGTKP